MFSVLKKSLWHLTYGVALAFILSIVSFIFAYTILWFNGHTPSQIEIDICMAFIAFCVWAGSFILLGRLLLGIIEFPRLPTGDSGPRSRETKLGRAFLHIAFGFVVAIVLALTARGIDIGVKIIMFDGLAKTITAHAVDTILFAGLAALLWQFMRATYENVRT